MHLILHVEEVGDEASEGGAAEQGGDEEAAGDGRAVRPARQQEVEQEEHRQSDRTEGSWGEKTKTQRQHSSSLNIVIC